MMKAESGVMHLSATWNVCGYLMLEEAGKDSLLWFLREHDPYEALISEFYPPEL
jgi:hypothetical protein